MKKLFLTTAIVFAGLSPNFGIALADTNEAMQESKYCREMSVDPICMGPESSAQRIQMMEMTKEKAMENRSKYCREKSNATDPICNEKMMNDVTAFGN